MTVPAPTTRTKFLFAAITFVLVVGILEAVSWIAIVLISPRIGEPIRRTHDIFRDQSERIERRLEADSSALFIVLDSTLGWRQQAGYRSAKYTMSSQGVRGAKMYTTVPRAGTLRAAAFGDSYVFGSEVGDSSAWPSVIERAFPGIEVPNYGVGGYGLDQTYLQYLGRGKELHPQVVIVGFVPDELRRAVNVYRRFLSSLEAPLVKPRFLLSSAGGLTLVPNPLPGDADYRRILRRPRDVLALGPLDYWYTPLVYENPLYDYSATVRLLTAFWIRGYRRFLDPERLYVHGVANPGTAAFRINIALFERLADSIRGRGAQPLLVFFPDREALERTTRGARPPYQSLLDTLRAHGLEPLDAAEAFAAVRVPDLGRWFMTVHYSPEGNRIVGLWLGRVLAGYRQASRVSGPS